jgi:membrane-associated phospholipid phosphatase
MPISSRDPTLTSLAHRLLLHAVPPNPEPAHGRSRPSTRGLAISFSLLAIAAAASYGGSWFIAARYPQRPTPRDTLFELLPYSAEARYLMAGALVAALALFARHAFVSVPDQLPKFFSIFALMYLLRAALISLTPLANAHGDGAFAFPAVQHGMFPSGHSAATLLFVLLTDPRRAPGLRRLLLVLAAIVWVTLLVAHGHYSIDVVGGLLLAYFCEREWSLGTLFDPLKRAIGQDVAAL